MAVVEAPVGRRGRFRRKIVSTDVKATKTLARTFFNQLRSSGYSPTQVIGVATELIDLVTCDLRDTDKALAAEQGGGLENKRQEA
jgi:hypothetical protein